MYGGWANKATFDMVTALRLKAGTARGYQTFHSFREATEKTGLKSLSLGNGERIELSHPDLDEDSLDEVVRYMSEIN